MTKESTTMNKANGIYFCGTVSQRRRKKVPKDNPTSTVVTYEFTDENSRTYYVDDFEPDNYFEVGQYVELPIRVKAYIHKITNRPAFSMTVAKSFDKVSEDIGEVF